MRPLNISGSQAKDYYYGKDVNFGTKDNSRWQGALAQQFGLAGRCEEHDFLNIIAGKDPGANHIIQVGVNGKHRAVVDIPM